MTPAEAAVLLTAIAANDNREVTEAGARALSAALPDIDLADALEFLPKFYRAATRDTKNWIYPGDVLNGVRDLHAERRTAVLDAARREALDAIDRLALEGAPEDEWVSPADTDLRAVRARMEAGRTYDAEHLPQCAICTADAEERAKKRAADERRDSMAWAGGMG